MTTSTTSTTSTTETKPGAKCRSCGAPIVWKQTPKGANCPYNADGTSHFTTCPNAAQHSRSVSKDNLSVGERLDRLERRVGTMAKWLRDNAKHIRG